MTPQAIWRVVGGLIVVAILAAGWLLAVQPILTSKSGDELALADARAQQELIHLDIATMESLDRAGLETAARDIERQLPSAFDEASLYREIAAIVEAAGAELARVSIAPPVEFVGVPSLAALPEGLAPANTPEALQAAADRGLTVATATIEFEVERLQQTLEVLDGLAAAPRIMLVASGTLSETSTQVLTVELYFLRVEADGAAAGP